MSNNYYRIDTINLNPIISCLNKQVKNQINQKEKEKTITLFYSPLIFFFHLLLIDIYKSSKYF